MVFSVDDKNIFQILSLTHIVMWGKHHNVSGVKFFRGKRLTISADEPFYVHAGGEIVGVNVRRVEIGVLFVHMFRVFLMKAYRKPRELMWLSGVALLLLVLGFGFTGYLLPWDTKAYFATLIGTEVPKSVPFLGGWGVSLVKGTEYVGEETLTRMYSLHVIALPLIGCVMVASTPCLISFQESLFPQAQRSARNRSRSFQTSLTGTSLPGLPDLQS